MFLLSKLLPLLVLPLGLSLLLLAWASCRGGRAPVLAALGLLGLFSSPWTSEVLWHILEHPYQRESAAVLLARRSPPPLAAVVVLGSGRHPAPGPERISEWHDADRFFGGIEAYQQLRNRGQRPRLIFAGGWWPSQPHLPPEGEVLRQRAIDLGLPRSDLLSTVRVRNTAEEAAAVAALLPSRSTLLLVTSAFHMHRARRLFERRGLRVIPFPVDFQASGAWAGQSLADPLRLLPSADALAASSRALRELLGRTIARGW